MSQQKITIKVSSRGGVTIDAKGFSGDSCHQHTQGFDRLFAGGGENETFIKNEWMGVEEEHEHN